MQENNKNQDNLAEDNNKFDWKYLIPTWGLYFVYKSPAQKKDKWWAMSIASTLIGMLIIFGGDSDSSKNKENKSNAENVTTQEEKLEAVKIDLKDKIKFISCNCAVTKVKTDDAVYAGRVLIMKAQYKDVLKCKSVLLNQNDVKIDTDFSVTWNMQTKTGAPIESLSSKAGEFLPPNVKVNWETEKDYMFESDKLQDVKKRLSKTTCEISDVKAVK